MISVKEILKTVAEEYEVTVENIRSQRRTQNLAEARHIAMYLLRTSRNLSFPNIGAILGARDHSTIIHGYRKIASNLNDNLDLKFRVDGIIELLSGRKYSSRKEIVEEERELEELKTKRVKQEFNGIPKKIKSEERSKKMLEGYRKGKTLAEIGTVFALTRERVRQLITRELWAEIDEYAKEEQIIDIKEFLKAEKLGHNLARNKFSGEKIEKESHPEIKKKIKRWSRFYIQCRDCGTTTIPHFKKGLCEKCSGVFLGRRREEIINRLGSICKNCGIERGRAILEFGRDFYLTKDDNSSSIILCRGCFLSTTGKKLSESSPIVKKFIRKRTLHLST